MVNVSATQQTISNYAASLGSWVGLCTGAPGVTATPANECAGGSPAYARQATTWTPAGSGGVNNGSPVTFNVPAGTYPYAILCSANIGNWMVDWAQILALTVTAQAQIVVTPTITAS